MAMRVGDFSRMAETGGVFRVDSGSGQLQVGQKSLWGKVVAWFRAKSDPGKVQGENMSAMNSFIRAIGEDPKYGPKFADLASRELSPLLESGKPLTARMVRQVIGNLDRQAALVKGQNRFLGERFAEYDIHGDPNCFGSVFADVCGEKGFNIPLSGLDVSRLKEAIRKGIEDAGQNGQHAVTIQEAKTLARQEVERFVDAKLALFKSIDGMDASQTDKTALKELACKYGNIRKPEYLQQVLSLKTEAHKLLATLAKPDCSRAEVMKAIAQYNEVYGKAFGPIRDGASGADDVVRFGGDAFAFALSTSGLDKDARQRIYGLLTSPSCRELRQAFGYIGNHQMDIGVDDETAQATTAVLGRSQEFISELATEVGLTLGLARRDTFRALDEPPLVFSGWVEIPKEVGDFARALGATVPTGIEDIHKGMTEELDTHKNDPVQILRGNTDVSKLIAGYMGNHGKPCLDHALRCLDQAKLGGGDAQAVYQRFLTAFLGGTTPRQVLTFVSSHPEIFGPIRELARDLHAQGLDQGGQDHAFFGVQNSVFLRGLVPALTMHNFDNTNPQANAIERQVGRLFQNGVGSLRGDSPDPLLQAFFNALTREDVNPERLETRFNQLAGKLLAHKTDAVNDESGPLHAPQAFSREVVEFSQTLSEMRQYCEDLGLDFGATFPQVDERMVSVVSHLAGVVKPSNLMLGELNRRQLGGLETALKSLGVDYPQTPFRTENDTRLTPLRDAYQQALGNLATAVRGQDPQVILRRLGEVYDTGQQLLEATNELGGRIDDPDKIKTFRTEAFRTALSNMPENDVLELLGALNLPSTRILQDGVVEAGYGVLRQNESLGKQMLTTAIGLGELRDVTTSFLRERGVSLPPLPDTKEYGLGDLSGPQRTALRSVFGVAFDAGKVWIASGPVNERFMSDFLDRLHTPLVENERAMKTLGRGEKTGVTEQFWKDFARAASWNIRDSGGTRPLYVRDGWEPLGQEGQEIRLMDGVRQLRELCGNDPGMLEFVTQHSHQGLFAGILEGCKGRDGCPLRLPDGRFGIPMPGQEHMSYTFSRNESGDVSVRVSWRADPLAHLLSPDGQMINLDPTSSTCQFDFEITFTRDQQVLVSDPVRFSYDIKEQ